MANVATTDAVLTAFFAADGVCDKMEASKYITTHQKTRLGALQTKHGAGTDFTSGDAQIMYTAFEKYLKSAT